jgi:Cdc6-like AAA superfamily ATPase
MANDGPKTEEDWTALDYEALTLFSPATPISVAELFAGRTEQIKRLLEAVLERGRHAVLFGERGVGKTSLTNIFHVLVGAELSSSIIPIRKQITPHDTFTSLWRRIFQEMTIQIVRNGEEQDVAVSDLYKGEITTDDVLREMREFSLNKTPVLIFDEFDRIGDDDTKRMMSHTVKALADDGANCTIVIVGIAEDINALIAEHGSIHRNISEIKMPRMSNDELKLVLDKHIPRLGMKITPDAKWKIVTLSRGLPAYVHELGRGAARNAIQRHKIQIVESDVDAAIKTLIKQSDQSANNAYKRAIHSNKKNALYKQALLACAIAKTDDEGRFAPAAVVEPMSKMLNRKIKIANFSNHLNAFCEEERGRILERRGVPWGFQYRFSEPKMQPYVIMQGIADGSLRLDALSILSAPEQPRLSSEF